MPPRQIVQGVLFEETDAVPPPQLATATTSSFAAADGAVDADRGRGAQPGGVR